MPAVNFTVNWPDGDVVNYYCPSSIIYEHLSAGQSFELGDFATISKRLLEQASERVREKFGFYCSAASGEQQKIATKLKTLNGKNIQGRVKILALE